VTEVVAEIVAAAGRGVRVDLILETAAQDGGTLHGPDQRRSCVREAARLRDLLTPARQLHAKIIAADSATALVSSANLTGGALADNIEVGVILRSPDVVGRIVRHFDALMSPRAGVLETLH
jgi:phosphatidylserine/phosphatidylglycerophosphate/cardiolipin synthase-like enzyme